MEFELKTITKEGVAAAIEKADKYRDLNDPEQAESICRDILAVDPDHERAHVTLLLAMTDQFATHSMSASVRQAKQLLDLESELLAHMASVLSMCMVDGCRASFGAQRHPGAIGSLRSVLILELRNGGQAAVDVPTAARES